MRSTMAFLGLLLAPGGAWAHSLLATCRLDGGIVRVEAFFDTDDPAAGAKIEAFDSNGQTIAAGVADAKGLWSFPRPAEDRFRVEIDAGLGHRYTLQFPTEKSRGRRESTRFPWAGLAGGLAVLAGTALLSWWWTSRTKRNAPAVED